jgi:predicted Zn-dependent peptidase
MISPRLVGRALVPALVAALSAFGCDYGIRLSGSPRSADLEPADTSLPAPSVAPSASASASPVDPLGPEPTIGVAPAFEPPTPETFTTKSGLQVWLVRRPALPLVTVTFVAPYGSSSDPSDKPGAAWLLADLLDEGAGKRSALQLSDAIAALGASLTTTAGVDGSFVQLTLLKSKLDQGFALLADVVARPTLAAADFDRVKKLWTSSLTKRGDDPAMVASLVANAVVHGPDAPYGHPTSGRLSKANAIDLASLKRLHAATFRPDKGTLVVVGRIERSEIEALIERDFAGFQPKGAPLALAIAPSAPEVAPPRIVIVDRPNAVQTVIATVGRGVEARSADLDGLALLNTVLGGSFTSRLNLNLREQKGWTYGVRSGFVAQRAAGTFVVRTGVEASHTGEAAREILGEVSKLAAEGITAAELTKTLAQDHADWVDAYETVSSTATRLASTVALGLSPDRDRQAARARRALGLEALAKLASTRIDASGMTIVLVGDRSSIVPQLEAVGLLGGSAGAPAIWTNEGYPAK